MSASDARYQAGEPRYRAIVQGLDLRVFTALPDGTLDFTNRFWSATAGQAAPGESWASAVHPDDRAQTLAAWHQAVSAGAPFRMEHRLRRPDGTYAWHLTTASAMHTPPGTPPQWVGASTEISASAVRIGELQAQIAEYERALEGAARALDSEIRQRTDLQSALLQARKLEAIGQLTGGVAHDFNNVLAAILGSYVLIRRRTDSAKVHEIVTYGEQAAERARKLIGQLLAFARREIVTPEMLTLPVVLRDLEDMIAHVAGPGVPCTIQAADGTWPVLADAHQLGIALLNLVANARDAMQNGGPVTIRTRNLPPDGLGGTTTPLPQGDYVSVSVHDTGEGMSPETLARAQEAFFTTKAHGKGTGLGLAMVQGFAREAGGTVRFTSAPGRGTDVEIILPRTRVLVSTPERMAALKTISAPSFSQHGNANILLVEDDDQLRPLTASYLTDLGYTVVTAASTDAAMVLVHGMETLDLLITDLSLPGEGGLKLAARLRAQNPGLPVLFLTGLPSAGGLENETVVAKPFNDTTLAGAVLRQLGRQVTVDLAAAEPLLSRLRHPAMRAMLIAWYTAKADGEGFPPAARLDPAQHGVAANAFVVTVQPSNPPLFHFTFTGQALTAELARWRDGGLAETRDAGEELIGTLDGVYSRCSSTAAPIYQTADYDFGDGAPYHFERLILPASDTGVTITHLVGIVLTGDAPPPATA